MTGPAYLPLSRDGRLAARAREALARLSSCVLCARRCGADRTQGIRRASCRIGRHAIVHSVGPYDGGGGAIVFAGCNMRCLFCDIAEASWDGKGEEADAESLAGHMLALQQRGHRCIALVSPSHVAAQIVEAVAIAAQRGLTVPLAWDSGGYDSPEGLALMDGVVDFYLPDAKFGDSTVARQLAGVTGYVDANRAAIAEMLRQVGPGGVLVRHLRLPHGLAGTEAVLAGLPEGVAVEVRDDYRP
ncbi:MAG TPA: radical SAM protein, partial [Candidatus Omnitrophota bacterium]|nr:radical SAM protein [Candidatus Omnitrophota bacterium]